MTLNPRHCRKTEMSESMTVAGDRLSARLNKPFEIVLLSKALSGYEWKPQYNSSALKLINRRYRRPKTKSFGAAAQVIFKFRPLRSGNYGITFELVRPFEEKAAERKAFALHVS